MCIKHQSQRSNIISRVHCDIAVNMSVASVLAAVYLTVILLLLEADAQPTVDETTTCGSSSLEEVVNFINITAIDQRQNSLQIKDEIKDVKSLLALISFSAVDSSKEALVAALFCECSYHVSVS